MKKVFQPSDLRRFRRQMVIVYIPFFLLFFFAADSWESRALFVLFATLFLVIINTLLNQAAKGGRPIILDAQGLHHENLRERYGSADYPWPEIIAIELIPGSKRGEWLGLTLRPGPFRASLKRPVTDRLGIAKSDVLLPLSHDQPGKVIVKEARTFWMRYRWHTE